MSNFDEFDRLNPHPKQGQNPEPLPSVISDNLTKRDRFELLSAYLDGEVTATERRQIEAWLKTDHKTQQLYARLLKLRQGLRALPMPPSEQPVEQVVQQVSAKLHRTPKRLIWGGLAFAALVVGSVVGTLPREFGSPQMANAPQNSERAIPQDGLMIALDRPVIEIPKAAVSSPNPAMKQSTLQ
jgi:anti-sigma factor RsiW